MAQWFYMRDDQKRGPVDTATLKQLGMSGELAPTDPIWREGLTQWVWASQAKGLFPEPVLAPEPSQCVPARAVGPAPELDSKREEKARPFCGELILVVAKKCKHSGEFLDHSIERLRVGDHPAISAESLPEPTRPTRAKYNPASHTFSGTTTLLVKLAMRAIQDLGWKLDNVNETMGMVTFETGMTWGSWSGVSCSLSIEEVSANEFRVTGTGKQNVRGGQLLALDLGGEAQGKVKRAINKMKELAR